MAQIIYAGESFKGQRFLTVMAVAVGVVASIYSIRTNSIQKKLAELQHEDFLEQKKEKEAARKAKEEQNSSAFNGFDDPTSKGEVNLPDGKYKGVWGGYSVSIAGKNGSSFEFKTNTGVRGRNVPVIVHVVNRIAHIKTL